MGPLALALIGGGLGALKSQEEKNMWSDQQRAEAEKSRYAPWTKQWGQNLEPPTGDMGNMMAGAATGLDVGSKMDDSAWKKGIVSQILQKNNPEEMDTSDMELMDDTREPDNLYKRQKQYRLFDDNTLDYLRGDEGTLMANKDKYSDILGYKTGH